MKDGDANCFDQPVHVQLQDTKVSDHVQFGAGKCIKKR